MKNILIVLLILLFVTAGSFILKAQDVDVPAPDFSLTDLQGNEISLSDYSGKVLCLNFWATWCPPCRAEIPDFIEAYKGHKEQDLEILGISVDSLTEEQLLSFVNKVKMNYPVAMADQKIIEAYEPGPYIPTTIIIDKKGIIRHRHVGQMNQKTLIKLFNEYGQ